jgi:signal peptidase II
MRENERVSAEPMSAADADPASAVDPADAANTAETTNQPKPAASRRTLVRFAAIVLAVVLLDVLTKIAVVANLSPPREPIRLLGGAIYLVEIRNSGAAFSVGTGMTLILTIVDIVVVGVIVRTARRMRSLAWTVALGLILGGALGNLSDRIFRSPGIGRGHVVDWISLFSNDGHVWPVFNVADSAVVCGAIAAVLTALLGIDIDGSRRR